MTGWHEVGPAALVAAVERRRAASADRATRVRRFLALNKGVEHVEVRVESSGRLRAVVWVAPTPSGLATGELPDGTVVTELNRYETTYLHQEIMVDQVYLPSALDLPPDAVVLDVGANIGLFSLFLARRLPGCRLVAFEPAPDAYAALVANVDALALPVVCLPWALGAESGRTSMTVYPNASVFSGLKADPDADRSAIRAAIGAAVGDDSTADVVEQVAADRVGGAIDVPVEVRRLSDVLDLLDVDRVDLVKLDAEGAELDILLHLRPEDWARIDNVVVEVHSTGDRRVLVALLEDAGFTCDVTHVEALEGTGFANLHATRPATPRTTVRRGPRAPAPIPPLTARQRLRQALDRFPGAGDVDLEVRPGPPPEAPVGPAERVAPESVPGVVDAWHRTLGAPPVGAADFFEHGGTSLLAVRLLSYLRHEHGYVLGLEDFLRSPTAAALAALCTRTP
ncbi:FkbM family methyltransferase [Umezawaea endophytica]|uniref:FkbM family methyltransferase n=1 Tax=Umezawaea endophytica TaxID=1654476 RepID=A0A9X3A3T6_9PSEU|nr:FkbM family methyltransferase [Umezawaea endophytica]MCS7480478.1 FkbM family methyltransferase [Umezawaea endophytica]